MNFMKYRYLYFGISLFVLIPGVISLLLFGVKPSIDFTGGSLLEIAVIEKEKTTEFSTERIQQLVGEEYDVSAVQRSGENQIIMRGKPATNTQKEIALQKLYLLSPVEEVRFETVGPVLGRELLEKTFIAAGVVTVFILLYVWKQFHSAKYGLAAILAMFHDSLILLGSFSLLGKFLNVEVDVLFVTALLTTLSFSVHDTIVVFDRIRELSKKHHNVPYVEILNAAILETMSRSINNSMTIIMMLLALVLLGGATIHWFAFALLIGAITGTYSSTFTAVPLLLVWDQGTRWWKQRKRTKKTI
jgi:preprotein translocase subunit SecF